jgi:hypothetical protein
MRVRMVDVDELEVYFTGDIHGVARLGRYLANGVVGNRVQEFHRTFGRYAGHQVLSEAPLVQSDRVRERSLLVLDVLHSPFVFGDGLP